ncbi:hypothetical protein APHAL10511_001549 [Amanita phalloides]|nr:hypothetical protein APHAL10511_001549 [Amanita phalloides]
MNDSQDRHSISAGGFGPSWNKPFSSPWSLFKREPLMPPSPDCTKPSEAQKHVPQTPTEKHCRELANEARSPHGRGQDTETKTTGDQAATQTGSRDAVHDLDIEWLKIAEEDSAVTIQCIDLGSSLVNFGAGLDVRSLKCGFDTCLVELKNLPLEVTQTDIKTLLSIQGVHSRAYRVLATQLYGDRAIRLSIIAQKDAAKRLASDLDNSKYKGRTIEVNVFGHNSLPEIQSMMPNILTISWECPQNSMIALLSYHDPSVARNFVDRVNREGLGGHPLRAIVMPSESHTLDTRVKTFKLPEGMGIFQLHSLSQADAILFQPDDGKQELVACLRQSLRLDSTVQIFDRTTSFGAKVFGVLNVTLDSWTSVRQASELLSGKRLKPEQPTLRCYLPFRKPIKYALYIPLEQSFRHHWDSVTEQHQRESSIASMHSAHGCIPWEAGLSVRVGTFDLDKYPALSFWHWASSSAPILNQIQLHFGISLIELSWTTRTLKLFAEDQNALKQALKQINLDVAKTTLVQHIITTDRRLIRSLQATGALAMLRQKFGEAGRVLLDTSSTRYILKHHESSSSAARGFLAAQKVQMENYRRTIGQDDESDASCPICLDDFSDPSTPVQRLVCGHVYCTDCLRQFLVTAPERNKLPLVCIGNEDKCRSAIPIPVMQSLLSPLEYDTLVHKVLSAYIGQRAEQYKYCPTPNCSQLYRVTTNTGRPNVAQVSTCPSCVLSVCMACNYPEHPNLTCAERRARDPSEHDVLNKQWASTHGAKKCPVCQVWIQKTEGCNHVKCRCGAHMCWLCERHFTNGTDTYRHLRAEHGVHGVWGVYLDPNANPVVLDGQGDAFFGAPPGPGEVLVGPGGLVVGPGMNAAAFDQRLRRHMAQGGVGDVNLANLVRDLNPPRRNRNDAAAPLPVVPVPVAFPPIPAAPFNVVNQQPVVPAFPPNPFFGIPPAQNVVPR